MTYTQVQIREMQGAFFCFKRHYHTDVEEDFFYLAKRLDRHGIPWHVQNTIAIAAENRANLYKNLRDIIAM